MNGYGDAPSFVMALPADIRRQILKRCNGDWARVTHDPDGSITVHNRPQIANVKEEVADVVLKSCENPIPDPLPPPRPALRPIGSAKKPVVDTTTFTRVEIPPARGTMRRLKTSARLAPPQNPADAQAREAAIKAAPEHIKAVKKPETPKPKPPTQDTLFAERDKPTPAPRTLPEPRQRPQGIRGRTGKPRSAIELLMRLLDLGCTFKRVPRSEWASVRYRGQPVGSVHCADSTPLETIKEDYRRTRRQIWTVKQMLRT